jgi:hypothetical protein
MANKSVKKGGTPALGIMTGNPIIDIILIIIFILAVSGVIK